MQTDDDELYRAQRGRLFGLAYRMLGSASEAEDVAQDAFERLAAQRRAGREIASPEGFLVTAATRLAIDRLRAARVRRESYPGQWLPEPILDTPVADPAEQAELSETISLAFLIVLERLSPVERAVFLLREVFGLEYDEIAGIVERSPDNCRQIALRARRHVDERRPRFEVDPQQRDELAGRFRRACEEGDVDGLVALLAPDVVLRGDGGGLAPALPRPLEGATRVARALAAFARVMLEHSLEMRAAVLNGEPGLLAVDGDGQVRCALALEPGADGIRSVRSQVNPQKLGHLARPR